MDYAKQKQEIYAEYAKTYDGDREKLVGAEAMERRIHFFSESVANGDYVLDVGCGTGAFLKPISDRNPKSKFVGVDISPDMLDIAKEKIGERSNVELRQADVSGKLPFPDASFDVVVASNINYEVPDQNLLMKEAFRVLKPRMAGKTPARLAAGLMCLRDNSPVNEEYARISTRQMLWHYLSSDELIDIIRHAGFHILGHRPVFIENKVINSAILARQVTFKGYYSVYDELTKLGYDPSSVSQGHIWVHAVKP